MYGYTTDMSKCFWQRNNVNFFDFNGETGQGKSPDPGILHTPQNYSFRLCLKLHIQVQRSNCHCFEELSVFCFGSDFSNHRISIFYIYHLVRFIVEVTYISFIFFKSQPSLSYNPFSHLVQHHLSALKDANRQTTAQTAINSLYGVKT